MITQRPKTVATAWKISRTKSNNPPKDELGLVAASFHSMYPEANQSKRLIGTTNKCIAIWSVADVSPSTTCISALHSRIIVSLFYRLLHNLVFKYPPLPVVLHLLLPLHPPCEPHFPFGPKHDTWDWSPWQYPIVGPFPRVPSTR